MVVLWFEAAQGRARRHEAMPGSPCRSNAARQTKVLVSPQVASYHGGRHVPKAPGSCWERLLAAAALR